MKRLITGIFAAVMLLMGTSALADNSTGYAGGATNGSETAYGTIKVMIAEWDFQNLKGYNTNGIVMSSYAGGGPTVDENGDCLVPLSALSICLGYNVTDENNTITLSHENRTIVVPYDGDNATVDGKKIEFPHEHIVPLYASWDSVRDNEIYFHYSYLPEIFGFEKAEWDKENLVLLITENESTPLSDAERKYRQNEAADILAMQTGENAAPASSPREKEQEIEPLPLTDNRSAFAGTPSQFSDIIDTSSLLNTCVNELVELGVISGYEDGTFRPDAPVTRAEAAAMICRLMGFETEGNSGFSDTADGEWYSGAVGKAAEIGIIDGYGDGTFKPDNNISYHEMLKLAYCLLGQPNLWYSSVVTSAVHEGLTSELKSFSEDDAVTRGDMCILLSKLLDTYITTWETDDGNEFYGDCEMTLADYLSGKPTVYHYFCSMKQYNAYGDMVNGEG